MTLLSHSHSPSPGVPVADDELGPFLAALFESAQRRQLWIAYFDDDDVVIPVLTPIDDVPDRAPVGALSPLASFVVQTARTVGAAAVALVWERPGERAASRELVDQAASCTDLIERSGVLVRARLLVHADGVEGMG